MRGQVVFPSLHHFCHCVLHHFFEEWLQGANLDHRSGFLTTIYRGSGFLGARPTTLRRALRELVQACLSSCRHGQPDDRALGLIVIGNQTQHRVTCGVYFLRSTVSSVRLIFVFVTDKKNVPTNCTPGTFSIVCETEHLTLWFLDKYLLNATLPLWVRQYMMLWRGSFQVLKLIGNI